MEGVEYQHRSRETFQPFADRRYPLSFDQRIQQGDDFRRSEEELSLALKSIEESFDGSPKEPHTGEPDCKTCIAQKERIWQAYRNFYLGDQPGRWDSNLPAYRQEITEMFSDPNKYTLETIQSRFHQELREHLKKDICFVRQDIDSASVEELKSGLRLVFQQDSVPTEVILRESLQAQLQVPGVVPRDAAEFLSALQNTTTSQERVQIYQKYYCTPAWGDTPQQKNMKAKYERLFESGMSHDNVLSQWKKEVLEIQNQKASQLKHRLGELQMAQSAHLKNKAKKAEKDQRMQDFVQSQTAGCSLPRCQKVVDLEAEEGALECVVCKWLANKAQTEGRRREHAYYCSEEHAEEDFGDHDHYEHGCCMRNDCFSERGSFPGGETGSGGICQDCLNSGFISYFCTQECWSHNMETHRQVHHFEKDIQDHAEELELCQPELGLGISQLSPSRS